MRRIKIIKMYIDDRYDGYESTETNRTFADGIDWHEVDESRYTELWGLISFANQHQYQLKADYRLFMVEEITPATVEVHLEKAKALQIEYQKAQEKQRAKEEKTRAAREEKRKATEMERKRKQLEKLQKELEDQK